MYHALTIQHPPKGVTGKILEFTGESNRGVFLGGNNNSNAVVPVTGTGYDFIAGSGAADEYIAYANALDGLGSFLAKHQRQHNMVLGYIAYDVKNEIENLNSSNTAYTGFPLVHFFVPENLFICKDGILTVQSTKADPSVLYNHVMEISLSGDEAFTGTLAVGVHYKKYIETVLDILRDIQNGDVYELNFCHSLLFDVLEASPTGVYRNLVNFSPNPFSAYYRFEDNHLACASPERFLCRRGNKLFSQPIKGTAPRDSNPEADNRNRLALLSSEKERSENVMIVDLVRNDLSRIAAKGSVKTDELFGVYTFPRSHQMISTISCELKNSGSFTDIIRAMFPMGSMTGAPKISAMKLIDGYENFRRQLFSGTVGYIHPSGDFDFNVVIRCILMDMKRKTALVPAGGAITANSDPQKEFEETMVKLLPQIQALGFDGALFMEKLKTQKHV